MRKDDAHEAPVINLLLRSYLAQHQYEQADKLIARSTFPAGAPQAQVVRWLFYAGRLRAVQLNYAQARDYLQTAIRRAPKDELAPGFVQLVSLFGTIIVGKTRRSIENGGVAAIGEILDGKMTSSCTSFTLSSSF